MHLVRLIYSSEADSSITKDVVKDIHTNAMNNNSKECISGMLCFNSKYFIQCLEGDYEKISHLYSKIIKDQRHHNVLLLHFDQIETRAFAGWSMAYMGEYLFAKEIILKYSSEDSFNPRNFLGEKSNLLVTSISEKVSETIAKNQDSLKLSVLG